MTERSRNIAVGLTAIAGLVCLAYLIVGVFGKVPAWVTDSYPLTIHLNDAGGIATGSRVRLNGIDVGYVKSVQLKDPAHEGTLLNCMIVKEHRIPSDAKVVAAASLLGGTTQLNIKAYAPQDGRVAAPLPTDGSATLTGSSSGFTDMVERLEGDLRKQLENFDKVSAKIVELADVYKLVGDNVNTLLAEQTVQDVDSGKVAANFRTIIIRADRSLVELTSTLGQIKKFASDEMSDQVKGTVADVRDTVKETREKLGVLLDRYTTVADELSVTLGSVNGLLAEANAGRGNVGKLFKDEALYNSLTDAAHRLTDALNEAKLLIQKWKAEGLPIQF